MPFLASPVAVQETEDSASTTEVEEPKPRPFLRAQKRRSERAAHAATTKKQRDSSPTGPIQVAQPEAILLAAEAKVQELQKEQKANQAQLVKLESEISKLQKSLKSAELKKPSTPKSRRCSSPSLRRRSQQL